MPKITDEIKNKQMVVIKDMPDDKAKDVLLTLAWKSKTSLVAIVLVERGIINPLAFAKEVLKDA